MPGKVRKAVERASIAVYMPQDVHRLLVRTAERERRSVSMQALVYIEKGLEQGGSEKD